MTGGDLDEETEALASEYGVAAFHFSDSRGATGRGWPDWVIIGTRGILFRETKGDGDKLSGHQRAVGYALQAHGLNWGTWTSMDYRNGHMRREIEAIK